MRAFLDAHRVAQLKPQPGSAEWDRWQELSKIAMEANGEYIEELERYHAMSSDAES
jgi:hypothetical protein